MAAFQRISRIAIIIRNDWHQIQRKQTMNDITFYENVAHMFREKQSFGCIVYIFMIHFNSCDAILYWEESVDCDNIFMS